MGSSTVAYRQVNSSSSRYRIRQLLSSLLAARFHRHYWSSYDLPRSFNSLRMRSLASIPPWLQRKHLLEHKHDVPIFLLHIWSCLPLGISDYQLCDRLACDDVHG